MRNVGYKWRLVGMLWLVCLFNYSDRQAIFSVFPRLQREMGLTDVQLGIVGGMFMWVYAAALPLAGMVSDRFSRKTLILAGLIFWSLVTLATGFSTKYWHLVLWRGLEGLGEAFYFPASMALISAYHSSATRSRAMALHQSSVYAGTILGGTAAGIFAEYAQWRTGFFVFGGAGILLGLFLWKGLKDGPETAPDEPSREGRSPNFWRGALELFRIRLFVFLVMMFVGANFVASILLTWLPTFLSRKFGMNLALAGLNATLWLQLASVTGVLAGGVLADRLSRRFSLGRILTQGIGLLCGVPFAYLLGSATNSHTLIAAMIGMGLFKGLYDANIFAALHDVVPVAQRASAVGIMNSIGWIGGGIAPVAIARASARFGMSACISSTAVIYLCLGTAMIMVGKHPKQKMSGA